MSDIKKQMADIGSKAAGHVAKASAKAAGSAAKQGAKLAAEEIRDPKSKAEWLVRVLTRLPKYLRLYFCLLTDNRVSSKVKALLVTAVSALGASYAFGGVLLTIQGILGNIIGPLAFIPTILIVLLTLDLCYTLINNEVIEEYEKEIFGESNSLQSDIMHLRDYLGSSYDTFKNWWQKKADRVEVQMRVDGLIVSGELTDAAIQDASDQIVELETSDEIQKEIDNNVNLLAKDKTANGAFKLVEQILTE